MRKRITTRELRNERRKEIEYSRNLALKLAQHSEVWICYSPLHKQHLVLSEKTFLQFKKNMDSTARKCWLFKNKSDGKNNNIQ